MIYVLNKNKIFSYLVASFIVVALFTFSTSILQNKDTQLIKVSSNIILDKSIYDYSGNNYMN